MVLTNAKLLLVTTESHSHVTKHRSFQPSRFWVSDRDPKHWFLKLISPTETSNKAGPPKRVPFQTNKNVSNGVVVMPRSAPRQ